MENLKFNIIHLPNAIERFNHITPIFYGLNYEFITPIFDEKPQVSLTKTHIDLIKKAKANNDDYVIVFEDDISPTKHFGKLEDIILRAKNIGADVLLGGVTFAGQQFEKAKKTDDPALIELQQFDGTHLCVYFKSMFDKVDDMVDNIVIRESIRRLAVKTVVSIPFLANQIKFDDSLSQSVDAFKFSEFDVIKQL